MCPCFILHFLAVYVSMYPCFILHFLAVYVSMYPCFILQWPGSSTSDESAVYSLCVSAAYLGQILTLVGRPPPRPAKMLFPGTQFKIHLRSPSCCVSVIIYLYILHVMITCTSTCVLVMLQINVIILLYTVLLFIPVHV